MNEIAKRLRRRAATEGTDMRTMTAALLIEAAVEIERLERRFLPDAVPHARGKQPVIDLTKEDGRLEFARQAWLKFSEGTRRDPDQARTRFIANIQIAIRDAIETGATDSLEGPQMIYIPLSAT